MHFKYLIFHTPNGERSVLFTNINNRPKFRIKSIGGPLKLPEFKQGFSASDKREAIKEMRRKIVSGGFCTITAQNIEGEKPWRLDCWGSLTNFGVESRTEIDSEIIEKDFEFSSL